MINIDLKSLSYSELLYIEKTNVNFREAVDSLELWTHLLKRDFRLDEHEISEISSAKEARDLYKSRVNPKPDISDRYSPVQMVWFLPRNNVFEFWVYEYSYKSKNTSFFKCSVDDIPKLLLLGELKPYKKTDSYIEIGDILIPAYDEVLHALEKAPKPVKNTVIQEPSASEQHNCKDHSIGAFRLGESEFLFEPDTGLVFIIGSDEKARLFNQVKDRKLVEIDTTDPIVDRYLKLGIRRIYREEFRSVEKAESELRKLNFID